MENSDFVKNYKNIPPETLENLGLLFRAKSTGYVCPNCGNGQGSDGTGINFNLVKDGYKAYCHKCDKFFDVFDLISDRYRLNNFPEILDKAKELFGDKELPKPRANVQEKPKKNFKRLLQIAQGNLKDFVEHQGGSWRGLTYETLEKFHCGHLPNWLRTAKSLWQYDKVMDETSRVIIPTSNYHYLARLTYKSDDKNIEQKQHRGKKEVFGYGTALDRLKISTDIFIFAVEGEIDAMSIYQSGYVAIAFSGSKITDKMASQLKNFPQETKFILMFDSDETGEKKSPAAQKTLTECGFKVFVSELDKGLGDFNDLLIKKPATLKKILSKVYEDAKEFFAFQGRGTEKKGWGKGDGGAGNYSSHIPHPTSLKSISTCPIDLEIPESFEFTLEGVFALTEIRRGKNVYVLKNIVTHTPCVPVKIFSRPDGTDQRVELAIRDNLTGTWHYQKVLQSEIADPRSVLNFSAFGLSISGSTRAKFLSNFLTDIQHVGENAKKIPRQKIYPQPGWTNGDCEKFIYPPGDEEGAVMNGNFPYKEKYSSRGEAKDWAELFIEAYRSSVGVRYACGLALAAPLVRLCRTRNFQGALVAPSGSGKSAIAKVAASIFGNPEELKEILNATQNFTNELSHKYNDLFCWVDEFQAMDRYTRENFTNQIFYYSEEKSRGRLDRAGNEKEIFKFHGTRLFTAEQNILQETFTQGAHNRVICLQSDSLIENSLAMKIHQSIQNSYGHFGKMFIEYVQKNQEKVRETYQDFVAQYCPDCDLHLSDAHIQQISLVYTALFYFFRMLEEKNFITDAHQVYDPITLFFASDALFFGGILPAQVENDLTKRAMPIIAELRGTHSKMFFKETHGQDGRDFFEVPVMNPALGIKYKNGDVAFFHTPLKKYLEGEGFPSFESIIRALAAKDLILKSQSQNPRLQYRVEKTVGATRYRVYYFPRDSFLE